MDFLLTYLEKLHTRLLQSFVAMDLLSWFASIPSTLKAHPEIFFSIASFFLLYIYRLKRSRSVPVNWPFIGMLPAMVAHVHHLHDYGAKILAASGMNFTFKGPWFTGMELFMTCDPANVNHVFNTHLPIYPKGEEFREMFEIFGESLLTTDDEKWKAQRKMIHNLMINRNFRAYELHISRNKVEKGLVPILNRFAEEKKIVDLEDLFTRLTFDTIFDMALGVDPGSLSPEFPIHPLAEALDVASEVIFHRHLVPKSWWKVMKWLNIGKERKLAIAGEKMDKFVKETIAKRREYISKNRCDQDDCKDEHAVPRADFLTTYMIQTPEDGKKPADIEEFYEFLHSNAKSLVLAGRDTTGAAMAWFFWLLCKNPRVQQKIVEELKANWPEVEDETSRNKNTPFDHDGLSKLVYLYAALCECLRLYPTVAVQRKSAIKTDVLPSGHTVHPGTVLIFHLYSMGRMEEIWGKDCLEFKPERWILDNGELKYEPSYKFFAFNSGPRICLGKEMSINKMKTIVAAMLYNFQIEIVEGHVVEPKLSVIMHMKNGLKARIIKKEKRGW
ncbi:alkane hydroxylase MAH1-like [Typha angustifolia]|uniref:alkane hydroxylase MAH1-like n=1 Tax=Typha angustifolia TaxID=59011 RepID=UPI003C2D6694